MKMVRIYEGRFDKQRWDQKENLWKNTHDLGCQVFVLANNEYEADEKIKNVVNKLYERFGGEYRGVIYNSPIAVDGIVLINNCGETLGTVGVKL